MVRIDLKAMANASTCAESYRMESLDSDGNIIYNGTTTDPDACVVVLDLSTLHPYARGFKRGFVGYPYVYLSPGEFSVPIRLNMENFTIATAVAIDLTLVSITYGGYSGGFADGSWACFK